jgi:hypothetical protein
MTQWQFSAPVQWHGKGFSLSFDFPGAWLVLLHFDNGERKAWYRRTERPYRFRRWFFRKGKSRFQNIANVLSPEVRLYVFRGFSPFPEKILVPMDVRLLRVREPEAQIQDMQPVKPSLPVSVLRPFIRNSKPSLAFRTPALQIRDLTAGLSQSFSESLKQDFLSFKEKKQTSSR